MRILEQLYFGNLDLNEYMPKSDAYRKVLNRSARLEEALVERLEGKAQALFIEYASAQGELNGISAAETFVMGFGIGAAVMAEAQEAAGLVVR